MLNWISSCIDIVFLKWVILILPYGKKWTTIMCDSSFQSTEIQEVPYKSVRKGVAPISKLAMKPLA